MTRYRTKYRIHVIALVLLMVFVLSCESEQRSAPIVYDYPEVISFTEHIMPIFEGTSEGIELTGMGSSCTSCHAGQTPPDLTSENAYIELIAGGHIDKEDAVSSLLYEKVAEGGSMNKYTNYLDIEFILLWIDQGALEN